MARLRSNTSWHRDTVGLGKLQLGKETTPGTSVAATSVWRGAASFISDDRVVKIVEEQVGILGSTNRSYISELMAEHQTQ